MRGQIFMLRPGLLFKRVGITAVFSFLLCAGVNASETVEFKKNQTGLYRDVFDQNLYYEGTNFLHLERLYRALFGKRLRAKDVNVYDEVPDSSFFVNRHGRERLSAQELRDGPRDTDGPDLSGELTIIRGKFEGLHPGFFIRDSRGDEYLFKFDPQDYLELTTGAEAIASRFYHAIGYHVPQYTIAVFPPNKLVPGPDAKVVDSTGFKKKLTREKLEEFILLLPLSSDGKLRASASKILKGENKGSFSFQKRRRNDPDDPVDHKDRRSIRALQVFSAWLNNYDVRESNTLDMLVTEEGRKFLRHYVIDFGNALGAGAAGEGPKDPVMGHEYLFDYGEALKAFLSLGLWEKPWQKRSRESGKETREAPAVGYFDNRYFDPSKYKTQLPYFPFKDLSRADGFWAAKIIASFTDEDIKTMVEAGALSLPQDAEYIAKTLAERRDGIVKYWFREANPLDQFELKGNELTFADLAVQYGVESPSGSTYEVDVIRKTGKRGQKIKTFTVQSPAIAVEKEWFAQGEGIDLLIRTRRPNSSKPSPYVLVEINAKGLAGILHED